MSLAIDVNKVHAVLLADGWHSVIDNSFKIGTYEYIDGDADAGGAGFPRYDGAEGKAAPPTGFAFTENLPASTAQSGRRITIEGPISSILAVRART